MQAEYEKKDPFSSPAFRSLREFVFETRNAGPGDGGTEEFERELHSRLMAVERDLVRDHIAQYDLDAKEIEVGAEQFRWKMKSKQEYCGLAGTFEIERSIYVPARRNGREGSARWSCEPASSRAHGRRWQRAS